MAIILRRAAPRAFNALRAASLQPAQLARPTTPLFRRFSTTQAEQPRLRLGSTGAFPNQRDTNLQRLTYSASPKLQSQNYTWRH